LLCNRLPGNGSPRGTNENTTGPLRQFFPKGTDLSDLGQTATNDVARSMNDRTRRTFGWLLSKGFLDPFDTENFPLKDRKYTFAAKILSNCGRFFRFWAWRLIHCGVTQQPVRWNAPARAMAQELAANKSTVALRT